MTCHPEAQLSKDGDVCHHEMMADDAMRNVADLEKSPAAPSSESCSTANCCRASASCTKSAATACKDSGIGDDNIRAGNMILKPMATGYRRP